MEINSRGLDMESKKFDSRDLLELFGRPALLRGESAKTYDEILERLMGCLAPRDFMEQMLIADYVCWSWEVRRYSRNKALSVERAARRLAEAQEKRRLEQALAAGERKKQAPCPEPSTEFGRMCELEDTVEGTIQDVDAIFDAACSELIRSQALAVTIATQMKFDELLTDAIDRQYASLALLERYRRGLGKRTQEACEQIITAEYKDISDLAGGAASPPVSPAEKPP